MEEKFVVADAWAGDYVGPFASREEAESWVATEGAKSPYPEGLIVRRAVARKEDAGEGDVVLPEAFEVKSEPEPEDETKAICRQWAAIEAGAWIAADRARQKRHWRAMREAVAVARQAAEHAGLRSPEAALMAAIFGVEPPPPPKPGEELMGLLRLGEAQRNRRAAARDAVLKEMDEHRRRKRNLAPQPRR